MTEWIQAIGSLIKAANLFKKLVEWVSKKKMLVKAQIIGTKSERMIGTCKSLMTEGLSNNVICKLYQLK